MRRAVLFFCRKLCFSSVGSTTVAGKAVLAERLTADDGLEVGTAEGVGVLLTAEVGEEVGRIGEVNLVSDLGTDRGSCLTTGAGAAPPDLLEEGTKDLAWLTVLVTLLRICFASSTTFFPLSNTPVILLSIAATDPTAPENKAMTKSNRLGLVRANISWLISLKGSTHTKNVAKEIAPKQLRAKLKGAIA